MNINSLLNCDPFWYAGFTYNRELCGTKGICNLVVNKHGQNTATRF